MLLLPPARRRKRKTRKRRGKKNRKGEKKGRVDVNSARVGTAAAAPGTIDACMAEPHDEEEGPPLSLHYLKLVDALGVLQRKRNSASVQAQQGSDDDVRPMPTPSSFKHCSVAQSFDDLSEEASTRTMPRKLAAKIAI